MMMLQNKYMISSNECITGGEQLLCEYLRMLICKYGDWCSANVVTSHY